MVKSIFLAATVALALAAASGAANAATGPLPPNWTHAEINYSVNHVAHTLILDRGVVTAVSSSSLTLREQDGTSAVIAVSSSTRVIIEGNPTGQILDIRRGEIALTQRVDGGSATQVRVHIPPRLAAKLARQQQRTSTTR